MRNTVQIFSNWKILSLGKPLVERHCPHNATQRLGLGYVHSVLAFLRGRSHLSKPAGFTGFLPVAVVGKVPLKLIELTLPQIALGRRGSSLRISVKASLTLTTCTAHTTVLLGIQKVDNLLVYIFRRVLQRVRKEITSKGLDTQIIN